MSMLISQSDAIIISTYLVGCWHTPACVCPMFINAHQKLLQPKHNIAFIPYYGESPVVSKYRKKNLNIQRKYQVKCDDGYMGYTHTHALSLSLSHTCSHLVWVVVLMRMWGVAICTMSKYVLVYWGMYGQRMGTPSMAATTSTTVAQCSTKQ